MFKRNLVSICGHPNIFVLTTNLICLTLVTVFSSPRLHAQVSKNDGDEFAIMSKRFTDHSKSVESVPAYPEKNGSWADINYDDTTKSNWQPAKHWERILLMAKASRTGRGQMVDEVLIDHIYHAMDFWFSKRPVCSNYWWNAIGVPLKMGETLLLLDTVISNDQMAKGLQAMEVGIKPDYYDYHGKATGQNAIWLSTVHLIIGIIQKDHSILRRVSETIGKEVIFTSGEGIQYDYSFHQHGPQLYSGGYGLSFARDVARLINIFYNTRYQLPQEQIEIFSDFILDGMQWMTYKSTIDYSTLGREIARTDEDKRAGLLMTVCDQMAEMNTSRKSNFQQMQSALTGQRSSVLSGNRHFWRSDFMTHHAGKFYTSIKTASSRIRATESGNGENLKGWYLGQGVQFIMRTGYEYHEIFPVWDWQRLPGHLCEQKPGALSLFSFGKGSEGKTAFTGGVSDGRFGLAANDYNFDNVRAKRTWFCFDDEIVCLGAAISCNTDNSLIQSINQCLQKGDVTIGTSAAKKVLGVQNNLQSSFSGVKYLHHDSIAYFFPGNKNIVVKTDLQTGSWRSINNQEQYSDDIIKKQVFSAWIDFGTRVNNQSYSYVIVPGINASDANRYKLSVSILRNDSGAQAVTQDQSKVTLAAFYKPGSLDLRNGLKLTVSQPVLVILKENQDSFTVSISNPENTNSRVVLNVNRELKCEGCEWSAQKKMTAVSMDTQPGNYAGQTVSKRLLK